MRWGSELKNSLRFLHINQATSNGRISQTLSQTLFDVRLTLGIGSGREAASQARLSSSAGNLVHTNSVLLQTLPFIQLHNL